MTEEHASLNFIEQIIADDLAAGFDPNKLRFRFPPEPNGYLHIGHAASICLNFGLGEQHNAPVNLRFDDTNPSKEEQEYVDAIKYDIQWLGFKWAKECYSSDYFQQMYDWAIQLIKEGKAYVDEQSAEAMAEQKGTPTTPGVPSPYRDRSVEENLDLFERMKEGEFEQGSYVLRAKIDMASPNMLMRDPLIYRIVRKAHHRTGTAWCIYPMYDWAHGESDYIEQVSHSLCTLEFKMHRELYDWFLDQIYDPSLLRPKQREFARRNLSYTVMSKRKLLELVQSKTVSGWDDPRMPTISGLRRRGYTPESIRKFSEVSGISKRDSVTDVSLLEYCIREDLNKTATRVMAVLDPVKLVITNYPAGKTELLTAENNPEDPNSGTHELPFSGELYIEREDFKEEAGNKFFRLTLGNEVRLKSAYIIKGESVVKDAAGNITEIHCTADLDSRSGSGTEASTRKVKGTLHWVSIQHAIKAEVREYDRLFLDEAPDSHEDKSFMDFINPESLKVIKEAYLEPFLQGASMEDKFQFQRLGYFTLDKDSKAEHLVFNKTVGLRDSWAKQQPAPAQKNQAAKQPNQGGGQAQGQRSAINEIQKIAKKYTNLSGDKLAAARATIAKLAEEVSYEELEPLFNTAAKKVGTRIGVMIALGVLLSKGQERTTEAEAFIAAGLADGNEELAGEAAKL
ncbi:glutamine--tRNA ligase/YqeY domain fusion protein [Algoriphagus halophytocola]|uniref:Glutamine--tRNA ligase n=1 Tax=Algoriphagus halophytocola TaxID=2991499 RepID=A0ABY6MIK5_9BACT|nr:MULTISPECIES: glutamine--tRNA ligase/YqeY domain fusion protein [unclassified Algoriphagus]UZD23463.1 glutamine--tRNA ligase/YqeY domain fusion protein [Algoriphagus sp. TR-M5]WBL44758.1 glutamine--tRNA ligase/YqeY domain fusion protein [Algoriphagus sp. TR-M9]